MRDSEYGARARVQEGRPRTEDPPYNLTYALSHTPSLRSDADSSHIRRGWKYTWLGVVSLVPSIISAWVAASWQPGWPTWAYYATVLPPSAGYAVFLCVGLSECAPLGCPSLPS